MCDSVVVDGDALRWPREEGEVRERVERLTAETELEWDRIASLSDEELTYENVILPLVTSSAFKTNPLVCEAKFLQHCSPNSTIRMAASRAGASIKQLRRKGRTRCDVYNTVQRYQRTLTSPLPPTQAHFLSAVTRDFRRSGLHLSETQRVQLEALRRRETDLCRQYNANVGQDQTILTFRPEELDGVGAAFVDAHRTAPGEVSVSVRYHDVMPIISSCSVEGTRKRISEARESCYSNNLELMVELVQLRKELAGLLGYASYAHYTCETSMVGTPEHALRFLEELHANLEPSIRREYERMVQYKVRHEGSGGGGVEGTIHPWDVAFFTNRIAEAEHGIDERAIMPYFPLDHVVSATFTLFGGILGLHFAEVPQSGFDSWHEKVRLFSITDADTGKSVGKLYLDLHPRQGKYAHAAMFFIRKRLNEVGPAAVMLANLHTVPHTAAQVLLRHREVVTFFHELGHGLHGLCAEGDGNMTRLAKCPRDYMEVTSQMFENWCWEADVLQTLSRHFETGESLPDKLIGQIRGSRHVAASMDTANHIFLSYLDLKLHTDPPADASEAQSLIDELRPRFSAISNPTGWNLLRNFCHVTDHYPSAYYSYLWSEVLSTDMYCSRFAKERSASSALGKEFRSTVLAPGGLRPAMSLVKGFLGRDPSHAPFLRSRGVDC